MKQFPDGKFLCPTYTRVVHSEEKGKSYKFNQHSIEVINWNLGTASIKSKKNPYWQKFIPLNPFPHLFSLRLGSLNRDANVHIVDYYKRRKLLGENIIAFLCQKYNSKKFVSNIIKYRDRNWWIYNFQRCTGERGSSLLQQSPGIVYLISSGPLFHSLRSKTYTRAMRYVSKMRRGQICEYYHFHPYSARVLGKIIPQSLNTNILWKLRYSLQDPAIRRRSSFITRYNIGNLYLLFSPETSLLCSNTLLEEVGHDQRENRRCITYNLLKDIIRMHKILAENNIRPGNLINGYFKSFEQVHAIHNDYVTKLNSTTSSINYKYSDSNLKDIISQNIHIEQIRTCVELKIEALNMQHCIYSYKNRLYDNDDLFCGRIFKPERLTFLYRKDDSGNFLLMEVRGVRNHEPRNPYSLKIINSWLESSPLESSFLNPNQVCLFEEI